MVLPGAPTRYPSLHAMRRGSPDTNNSQFLISTSPAAELRGRYTICGQVVAGFGVVRQVGGGAGQWAGRVRLRQVFAGLQA